MGATIQKDVKYKRITLGGTLQGRNTNVHSFLTKDQLFENCVPELIENPLSGNKDIWWNKQQALADAVATTFVTITQHNRFLMWIGNNYQFVGSGWDGTNPYFIVGGGVYRIYGNSSNRIISLIETTIGTTPAILFVTGDYTSSGAGYFYTSTMQTAQQTGTYTSGSPIVTGLSDTTNMYVGQYLTGSPIATDTYILTIDSGTQITLSANATAGAPTAYATTFLPYARIIDADFPANASKQLHSGFAVLDGYNFIVTSDGLIYNSDLNSIQNWTSTSFISANKNPDAALDLITFKNYLLVFGVNSIEIFENVGSPDGSPLLKQQKLFKDIGTYKGSTITANNHVAFIMDEYLYFIGHLKGGKAGLYRLSSTLQIEKVSNSFIDKLLTESVSVNQLASIGNREGLGIIGTGVLNGSKFLAFRAGTQASPVYYFWEEVGLFTHSTENIYGVVGLNGVNYSIYGATTTSRYKSGITGTNYSLTMLIRTEALDFDSRKRKFIHKFEVVGDKPNSTTSSTIYWIDAENGSTSSLYTVDLSTRAYRTNLGSSRKRSFVFYDATSNVPIRIKAFDITYTEGLK